MYSKSVYFCDFAKSHNAVFFLVLAQFIFTLSWNFVSFRPRNCHILCTFVHMYVLGQIKYKFKSFILFVWLIKQRHDNKNLNCFILISVDWTVVWFRLAMWRHLPSVLESDAVQRVAAYIQNILKLFHHFSVTENAEIKIWIILKPIKFRFIELWHD
jgi:hypothetical protein